MKKQWIIAILMLAMLAFLIFKFAGDDSNKKDDSIKIGAILPLTGNAAALGNSTLNGITMAIEEYNNSVNEPLERKVVLEALDSKGDPKEGVSLAQKLFASNNSPKMVYSIMSGVTLAFQSITEKNSVPLVAAVGTEKLLTGSNFSFRNYISPANIGKQLSGLLQDTLKVKTLGIYYSNNDFGQSVKNSVENESLNKGIKVSFADPFEEKNKEYRTLITKNKALAIDCIYVAGVGQALGILIRQIRESGYKGIIIGDPTIPFPDVVSSAGEYIDGINYLDFAFDLNSTNTLTAEFVDNYRKRFNQDPQNFSIIAYDAIKTILKNVKKNKFNFDEAIKNIKNEPGTFGEINVVGKEFFYNTKIKTYRLKK